jgi:hypothetical protein
MDVLFICLDLSIMATCQVDTLKCLTEMVMGPCLGNQDFLSKNDALLNAVDKVDSDAKKTHIKRNEKGCPSLLSLCVRVRCPHP